jgi:hypothetical protein
MPLSMVKSQKVAASKQMASEPLRLTRRGRVVLTGLTALLVTAAMVALGIGTGTAQATNSAPSRGGGEGRYLTRVTVSPGQNLWSVAENTDPDSDPRVIIAEVIGLNELTGTTIYPGEQLWVPRE